MKTTLALDLKNKSIRFSKKVVAKREVNHFSLFARQEIPRGFISLHALDDP